MACSLAMLCVSLLLHLSMPLPAGGNAGDECRALRLCGWWLWCTVPWRLRAHILHAMCGGERVDACKFTWGRTVHMKMRLPAPAHGELCTESTEM